MRKILWTLATCGTIGASVTWTLAQEQAARPFPQTATPQNTAAGTARLNGGAAQGTEQPSVLDRLDGVSGARSSLFGSEPAANGPRPYRREANVSVSGAGRTSSQGITPVSNSEVAGRPENVVYAAYERLPGQREDVQHVRTGELPANMRSLLETREGGVTNADLSRFGAATQPGGRTTGLTTPVSTGSETSVYGDYAKLPQESASPRVSFTRSRVEPQGASEPKIVPAKAGPDVAVRVPVEVEGDSHVVPVGAAVQKTQRGSHSPTVTLEWVTRGGVNVGQESTCDLVVRNTGIISAREIEVSAQFPTNVRIVSVEPQPVSSQSHMSWSFDELQPGQERTIQITLIPTERGNIDTRADVRFSGTASTSLTVAEPLIEVACAGAKEVLVGEPASQTVVVKNPGNGIATNVTIETIVPAGLEHARGERLIMEVGSLNPGETRSVRLALAAVKGGRHVIQVQARADGNLVRNATSEVDVIAPSLVSEVTGPGLRYLGRNATYTIKIRNDGEITTENVRVMHKVPEGFEVVESDKGAQFDRPNRLMNWFVGRLQAGQSAEMNVTLRADKLGHFTHFVRATSEHGAISDAQFSTSVEGTPSLAMVISDLDDPVEVGVETAYEIKIKNEGSAAARNVCLSCEIPGGVTVTKAQGPVECIQQKDSVTFNPVIELAPGNSVTYRVHVKGSVVGNHRLRARLTSDTTPEGVTADELTRFYGE